MHRFVTYTPKAPLHTSKITGPTYVKLVLFHLYLHFRGIRIIFPLYAILAAIDDRQGISQRVLIAYK